jgi:acetyl-CoA C-acetyltransferase
MKNVAVIGIGQTRFGEHWNISIRDMAREAGVACLKDADMEMKNVEALYVGNMAGGRFAGQEHLAALVASELGVNIPSTRMEGACASGALAFRQAYMAVSSGRCDIVMVLGVEKMSDLSVSATSSVLMGAGDQELESVVGLTFPGLYALMAAAHMHRYGTTSEQMAMVSVNNHKNGVNNPYAQFRSEITTEAVLKSSLVADPLHILDCSPITDGAAALILASEKIAKKNQKTPGWVIVSEQTSDTLSLQDRKSITEMLAVKTAARNAFNISRLKSTDIDFLEVHDCFSINEILNIEDLGFCEKGGGGEFVENGEIKLTGNLPVNTTGGLKSIGHPVGASGVRQIIDVVRQLRGESFNQLNNPKYGLSLNIGGSGATVVLNILGSEINVP